MKVVKSFDESCLLIENVSQIIKNESKELKDGFLEMLLHTLAASILGNMLVVKPKRPGQGVIRAGEGIIWARKGITRAGQDF